MESHGFLLYTALKKITDLFFFYNGNVYLCVFVLVIVSINPCTFLRVHLAGSDNTNLNIIFFS